MGKDLRNLVCQGRLWGCKKTLIIIFRELVGELGTVASRVNYGQEMRKYKYTVETKKDFAVENAINLVA